MGLLEKIIRPASPRRFMKKMSTEVKRQGFNKTVRLDEANFCLHLGDEDDDHTLFLHNAYAYYCSASLSKRGEVIRNFAQSALNQPMIPDDFASIKKDLLPRLRERFYYEAVPLHLALNGQDTSKLDLLHRPLTDHLAIELAIDSELAISTVSCDQFDQWGISFDEAMTVARDNMWARSNERWQQTEHGVWVSPWTDNWDASRLVLHDLLWQLEVEGDHVAAVPNRDMLLVTGSENAAGLVQMADIVEQALQQPRPISGIPVVLQGDRWEPFTVPTDHPAHEKLRLLQVRSEGNDYNEQKELLDATTQAEGKDVFIASYSAFQHESGLVQSYCVWPDAVSWMWLPRTDLVMFMQGDPEDESAPEPIHVPWDRVQQVMGTVMQPLDMYPPRWEARVFPDADQLKALQSD